MKETESRLKSTKGYLGTVALGGKDESLPLLSTILIQGLPPRKTFFLETSSPEDVWLLLGGEILFRKPPHPQHPGHILALDIKVEDTNVVYQDSKRPISEVGGGLP